MEAITPRPVRRVKLSLKPMAKATRLSFETPPEPLPSRHPARTDHPEPELSHRRVKQEAFEASHRDDMEVEAMHARAPTRKIPLEDGTPARKRARRTRVSTPVLPTTPTPIPASTPRPTPASEVIDLVDTDDDDDVICVETVPAPTPPRSAAPVPAATVVDVSVSGGDGDSDGNGSGVAEGGDNVRAAAAGCTDTDTNGGTAGDDNDGAANGDGSAAKVSASSKSGGDSGGDGGSGSECVVCMETGKQKAAVVPCGHTQTCYECLDMLQQTEGQQWCPVCRGKIVSIVRLYGL